MREGGGPSRTVPFYSHCGKERKIVREGREERAKEIASSLSMLLLGPRKGRRSAKERSLSYFKLYRDFLKKKRKKRGKEGKGGVLQFLLIFLSNGVGFGRGGEGEKEPPDARDPFIHATYPKAKKKEERGEKKKEEGEGSCPVPSLLPPPYATGRFALGQKGGGSAFGPLLQS